MVQREGLKARLLQITFAKVDGQKVEIPLVERPAKPADAAAQSPPEAAAGSACGDASRQLVEA
jgi:hypothetical protein